MHEVDTATPHLWRQTAREPAPTRPPLAGDATADIGIVGGGFSALASALALAEGGLKVALLEQSYVGAGASGRNNGLVLSHHSRASPGEVEEALGKPQGERYNALVAGAPDRVFDIVERFGIDCDLIRNGWIQPAHSSATASGARRFHDEWKAFGADVEWLDREALAGRLGSPGYRCGWLTRRAGHINPFALVQGMARAAEGLGVKLFEASPVTAIRPAGKGWRLETPHGSVTAPQILVATNALTGSFWPRLREAMIPVKVFQAASRPVPAALRERILVGNPAVSDMRHDIRAFHYDGACRIVTGGTHTLWFDAARRGKKKMAPMLAETFPALGEVEMEHYWEGVLAVAPDRFPRLMRLADGVTFLGVYSGRGVALSSALGTIVGKWLAGRLGNEALPLPVTELRLIPMHGVAVQVARFIHPVHRLQDRLS